VKWLATAEQESIAQADLLSPSAAFYQRLTQISQDPNY